MMTENEVFSLIKSTEQFPVSLDKAWPWIGYSKKQNAKDKLTRNFYKDLDFSLLKVKETRADGSFSHYREQINLTVDCFKSLCMMAGTERGKQVRQMFAEELKCYDELKSIGLANQEITLSTDLVSVHKGQLVTDSLTLAQVFDKRHDDILRDISSKLSQSQNRTIVEFYSKHLLKCTYLNSYKQEQTKYLLTREGFSLLALGFTGGQAELYKIRYIEAFESMYKKLEGYALAHFFRDTTEKQFVYVIRNAITGLIKIGVTNNMKRRISQLECATGCELETIFCSVVADNAKEVEKNLHDKFAEFRQRGEWFNLDPDLVITAITKLPFKLDTTIN